MPTKIEEILDSRVEMAILRTLVKRDMPLPISRIAKEIGSNYVWVQKHLKPLKEANLVIAIDYGKRRLYKLNVNSQRIIALKQFLEAWLRGEKPNEGPL